MQNDLPAHLPSVEQLIDIESAHLLERRKQLFNKEEDLEGFEATKFGISLSGGGIRSATINLGLLKTLNTFGLLQRVDYLSSVSGGGYTAAYVQAMLQESKDYEQLFQEQHIDHMRSRGEYLIPGKGRTKRWNTLVLIAGFTSSLLMSWLSPVIVVALLLMLYTALTKVLPINQLQSFRQSLKDVDIWSYLWIPIVGTFLVHVAINLIKRYGLGQSKKVNHWEAFILLLIGIWMLIVNVIKVPEINFFGTTSIAEYIIIGVIIFLLGYIVNPNALSFHRFYRNQLAEAFLHFAPSNRNIKLHQLLPKKEQSKEDYLAPYPLINTCLNLQDDDDTKFSGTKAYDYFLLSPLYCGAKLTGYVNTATTPDYQDMTLPAATTISAAAVNPGMGMYSNKLLSIFMTVFNFRLGFWVHNPLKGKKSSLVWWPIYFFYELFSKIGTSNRKLNISDGGHIENLGVYELLRRKCRLIIAVDGGADPKYTFGDLEILTTRARNELGLEIRFRPDQIPESVIRPKPSFAYSDQRYAVADVFQLWEEFTPQDENGKAILDQSGKPIEVLLNYKKIKDGLNDLPPRERYYYLQLIEAIDFRQIVDQRQTDPTLAEKVVQEITQAMNNEMGKVFFAMLEIFNEVQHLVEKDLTQKLKFPDQRVIVLEAIFEILNKRLHKGLKIGTLVYVKSSITAPTSKLQIADRSSLDYQTYKYKIYHPKFPHEPTSDQFFDKVQWEAYYRLGQFIGAEVLGINQLKAYQEGRFEIPKIQFTDLMERFDSQIEEVVESEFTVSRGVVEREVAETVATVQEEEGLVAEASEAQPDHAQAKQKIVVGGEDHYSL